jgi:hypothetical protein
MPTYMFNPDCPWDERWPLEQCPQASPGGPVQTWPRPTLLVNAWRSISKAMGVGFSRGMYSVSLAFKRRIQARFPARF